MRDIKQSIRAMGLKLTPQRMAIAEHLKGNRSHPSADDVYRAVKDKCPGLSFATVYNTLEAMTERGGLRRVTIDHGRTRFDPDTSTHHHAICTSCGMVADVHVDFDLRMPARALKGFRVKGGHVEFHGLCPDCVIKEVNKMAVFKCEKCGATKEGRCKPKKCPKCGKEGVMVKQG